jgi:hypothetical protein
MMRRASRMGKRPVICRTNIAYERANLLGCQKLLTLFPRSGEIVHARLQILTRRFETKTCHWTRMYRNSINGKRPHR